MKIIKVEAGKPAYIKELDNSLEAMQKEVGGYIETYSPFNSSAVIVCNDAGKFNGMTPNRGIRSDSGELYDIIYGPFFICDGDGSEFGSIPDKLVDEYLELFKTPERMIIIGHYIDMIKVEEV